MKIGKYTTIDIYYNKSEAKLAKAKGKQLIKQGYSLEHTDSGSDDYDYCNQYVKVFPSINQTSPTK